MIGSMENILAVYSQATARELRDGLRWYGRAHRQADRLHIAPKVGAAVVAALSPGLRWEANIAAAEALIMGRSLAGFGRIWGANQRKAHAILSGAEPLDVLGGNKVRNFYRCILTPDSSAPVCIDGHAYGIWTAERIPLDSVPKISDTLYGQIAADYIFAARSAGILPMQMQAITWCAWRRMHVTKSWTLNSAA